MKKFFFSITLTCMSITTQAQNINGTWSGELNAGFQKIKVVLNLSDDGKCTLDSPDQGAYGIPATTNFVSADSVNVSVASLKASYTAKLQNGELKGTFTQNGFKLPLSLKPSEKAELKRPQNPQPPYPYETEEVTFQNTKAGATLAGTLTIPTNGSKYVLLMVTGSGAQNRDEEVFGHKPFAVIADRLARAGIATLRYDDRATGKSVGGMNPNVTTQDFAEDALSGIEWLRSQKRFKKIGIIGHSEGGTIAFMLASQKKVDFIVSLAGTSVKGDSVLLAQTKAMGGPQAQPDNRAIPSDARDAESMDQVVHRLRPTSRYCQNQVPRHGPQRKQRPAGHRLSEPPHPASHTPQKQTQRHQAIRWPQPPVPTLHHRPPHRIRHHRRNFLRTSHQRHHRLDQAIMVIFKGPFVQSTQKRLHLCTL